MTEIMTLDYSLALPRSKRLKAATSATHDNLDTSIMAGEPFSSRERYVLFLKVQYLFHRDIDALYDDVRLDALLPDLQGRRRFGQIGQDLADLGVVTPVVNTQPRFPTGSAADLSSALGWLYVAEGSNMGAAFLLKEAKKLGLSEEFGARHLAGAPEGRGLHWQTFTKALDEIELSANEEERVMSGGEGAFARVHSLVRELFG